MRVLKVLFVLLLPVMFVACSDDDSGFISRPDGKDSSPSVTPKSSDSKTSVLPGTMTDSRDGQTYRTVKIGTQTWMAENLNYAYTGVPYNHSGNTLDSTSWYYDNDASYSTKYGRLYTWAAAMDSVGTWSTNGKGCGYSVIGMTCSPDYLVRGVCPEGWHLPDSTEWNTLITTVGGSSTAGKVLKSTSGWNSSGNGTDAFGFSALPAGFRDIFEYYREGDVVRFWSSTEYDGYSAFFMDLYYDLDNAGLTHNGKYEGLSVRCLKD